MLLSLLERCLDVLLGMTTPHVDKLQHPWLDGKSGQHALWDPSRRAKDYAVIAELARLLPPGREIEHTTDPDRILELAPGSGADSTRPAVVAARSGRPRLDVVMALAREIDAAQQLDRRRVEVFEAASDRYLSEVRRLPREALTLPEGHARLVELAEQWLPPRPIDEDPAYADAQ